MVVIEQGAAICQGTMFGRQLEQRKIETAHVEKTRRAAVVRHEQFNHAGVVDDLNPWRAWGFAEVRSINNQTVSGDSLPTKSPTRLFR
jgi:hypothetical protein